MPYAEETPATYVSASGEFGVPGGGPPPSYEGGLSPWDAGDPVPTIPGISQGPTVQLDRPHPLAAPVPPPPATPAPSAAPSSGPYDAFNKAYRGAFGRDITQEQLNSNAYLQQLGNDLFRLLPLDRQVGFSSARLALLPNKDLTPVLERLGQLDPKGLATAFSTKFWLRFDNDWIANKMLPLLRQNNPAEADNIIRQNQIGGANAGALPAAQRPSTPLPGAPQTGSAPDLTGQLPAPGAPAGTPYTRPSGYDIPRITPSTVPALPIGEGGVPNALDLYLGMIGSSNYGRAPGVSGLGGAPGETVDNSGSYNFEKGGSSAGARLNAANPYETYARQAAQKAGIDPNIFVRQIQQESGFNPNAKSPAGAVGIAQIMPDTARGWGVDPTDPYASLDAAANAMAKYVKDYGGDYKVALAAYNAGPGAVEKYGGVPPFEETKRYIDSILNGAEGDTGGNDWTDYDPGTGTFLDRRTGRRVNPDGSDAAPPGFTYIKQPVLDVLGKPTGQYQYTLTHDPTYRPPSQGNPAVDPSRAGYYDAQTANLLAKAQSDLYAAQAAYQRAQAGRDQALIDQAKADLAEKQRQFDITKAQADAQLKQRQGEFAAQLPIQEAGATGFYGGAPTLDRERAIAQQDLANFTAKVDAAYRAGQIDLQMRNQAVQERAQALNERIQTGRLGLETRAQTESETQGAFGRGLQAAQFQFQVGKDPASAFVKTQNARDLLTPGGATGATPAQFGGSGGQFAVPQVQNYDQAFGQNPRVSSAVAAATGANGEFRIPSQQRLAGLLPSERAQLGAGLNVMGLNPEDVYEQSAKLTGVTPAPAVNTVVRRPRVPAGAY